MNGLVCATCRKFFRVKTVGMVFEEGMPLGRPNDDGSFNSWGPYKLWHADLCECPECGAQVLAGMGRRPLAEHYESGYDEFSKRLAPLFRVDDCGGKRP